MNEWIKQKNRVAVSTKGETNEPWLMIFSRRVETVCVHVCVHARLATVWADPNRGDILPNQPAHAAAAAAAVTPTAVYTVVSLLASSINRATV